MTEQWKPVAGFEDYYEVSDQGRVRKSGGRILKQSPFNKYGHMRASVRVGKKTKTLIIHRLVAEAFQVGGSGPHVRHLDGNPANNTVANLRFGTAAENAADKKAHGRFIFGASHKLAKLTDVAVADIRRRRTAGEKGVDLAREFGVSPSAISLVMRGKSWKYAQCST